MMDFEYNREDQKQLDESLIIKGEKHQDKIIPEENALDLIKNDEKKIDSGKDSFRIVIQENVENNIINEAPLIHAGVNAGNDENVFLRRPVPHISRDLAKAMRKILKWEGGLSRDAAQPVHDAIHEVLRADSESAFVDAMSALTERAVNYIRLRPGRRWGKRNGNQRKVDINNLLSEIAVFASNSSSALIFELEGRATGYSENVEGEQTFLNSFERELQRKYAGRKNDENEYWNLAEEDEEQMRNDLGQWGGSCADRARALLHERLNRDAEYNNDTTYELNMSPQNFLGFISKVKIPDTKALDDYQLLKYPGIESMRRTLYIPASQNLEKLILSGKITDMNMIGKLRAKVETIKMQLDLYDARLSRMAGAPDPENKNKNMILEALYLEDMEKRNAARIGDELKGEAQLSKYMDYQRSINPQWRPADEELDRRRLIIEQNRARKKYINDSFDNAKDIKLRRSEEADYIAHYKDLRGEIERLFNTDYSELFTTEFTESGMLRNCAKRYELVGMLSDLPKFMKILNEFEDNLPAVKKNRLLKQKLLLTEKERVKINGYIELGKLVSPYYTKLRGFWNTQDAAAYLAASDYDAINQHPVSEDERKRYETKTMRQALGTYMSDISSRLEYQKNKIDGISALIEADEKSERIVKDMKAAFTSAKEEFAAEKAAREAGLSNDKKKRLEGLEKANKYTLHTEKDLEAKIKEDPHAVAAEFKDNLLRATRERINKALDAYRALSGKDAKPGDEIKARSICVDTISTLSGIDQEAFELVPTDVIFEKLASIDQNEFFDQNGFFASTDEMIKNRFADGEGISDVLVPLCKKNEKSRNLAENVQVKEYSVLAIKKLVPKETAGREVLGQQDINLLSKIALGISLVSDKKRANKKDEKKIISTMATVLSVFTKEKKEKYEFMSQEAIANIMNEAIAAIGSNKDISGYIQTAVSIEENKKAIRDGMSKMDALDQSKATRADLDSCRETLVNSVCILSKMEKSSFDNVPLDRLYALVAECEGKADRQEELEKIIRDGVMSEESKITVNDFAAVKRELSGNSFMSEEMKNYIAAEYGMNIFDEVLGEFGLSDGRVHTRKDFDNMDTDVFTKAVFMGIDVLGTGSEAVDEKIVGEYRDKMVSWLSSCTGIKKEAFSVFFYHELKGIVADLVKASYDRASFAKACKEFYTNNERRKHGKAAAADFTRTMGRIIRLRDEKGKINEENAELRDFREVAINYLLYVANIEDGELTREKLEALPAMTLYSMVMAQTETEADYVPEPEVQVDIEKEVDDQLEAERLKEERVLEEKRKALEPQSKKQEDEKEEDKKEEKKDSPEELQKIIDSINSGEDVILNENIELTIQKQQKEAKKFEYELHRKQHDEMLQDKKLKKNKKQYEAALSKRKFYEDAIRGINIKLLNIDTQIVKNNELMKSLHAERSEKEHMKKELEEKLRAEQEEKLKRQQEEQLRREQEEKLRIEQDEQYRKEYEERQRAREEKRKTLIEEKKKALEEKRILELETKLINEYKERLEREEQDRKKKEERAEKEERPEQKEKDSITVASVKQYSPAEHTLLTQQIMDEELRRCMNIARMELLDKDALRQERKWSDNAQKTVDLIGSLVSVEKFYDKNGNELTKAKRAKLILSDNAGLLTALLNERSGNGEGKNTLQEIDKELYGAEKKVMSSIIDRYLTKLLEQFEEMSPGKKWAERDVLNILDGKDMTAFLETADELLDIAVKKGDSIVDDMITQAAKELFGSIEDRDVYLEMNRETVEIAQVALKAEIKDLLNELEEGIENLEGKNVIHEKPGELIDDIKALEKEKDNKKISKLIEDIKKLGEEKKNKKASDKLVDIVNKIGEKKKELEVNEKLIPKDVQKETDKEKLEKIRDSVFNMNKGQGKFLYDVISQYYQAASPEQRRFMMSYLIKDIKPTQQGVDARERGATFFASMLKGAGPILQKLFQGIPEHMLMKPFRPALSVVKSGLREIPPAYVDKTLLQLKSDANDNFLHKKNSKRVSSIKKLRSLGAASIAETFLCEVTYVDKDVTETKQVVVKIQRPDVNLERIEEERQFIEQCAINADKNGVMKATFDAHYNKIKEELDFAIEVDNAIKGEKVYKDNEGKVRSVKISNIFPSGKNYLVMDKAEGVTADRYIQEMKDLAAECMEMYKSLNSDNKGRFILPLSAQPRRTQIRKKLADKLTEAQMCQANIEKLVDIWVEKALFCSMGSSRYFHHGDLHAGNIMINKDFATVLDYGNCTVLKNSGFKFLKAGKVDAIVKMMAAASRGFTTHFVNYLAEFINNDDGNEYNSFDKKQKLAMKEKLAKELEEVFKLGGAEDTGGRIFVALLKAQEVGFKLPKEILNFSQCQQRLENSLNEFNNAIEELRGVLGILDSMRIKELENFIGTARSPYNEILNNFQSQNNIPAAIRDLEQSYMTFKSFDREEVRKNIRDIDNADLFREGQFGKFNAVRETIDYVKSNTKKGEKDTFTLLHEKMQQYKKEFPEFMTYKDLKKEDITDPEKLKKYDHYKAMVDEIANCMYPLSELDALTEPFGGFGRFASLASMAALYYDKASFDELYDLVEVKLVKAYNVSKKYEQYVEAASSKKKDQKLIARLENEFLDMFGQIYDTDTLDKREMVEFKKWMSLELEPGSYLQFTREKVYSTLRGYDDGSKCRALTKSEGSSEDGEAKEKFKYGERAEKVIANWNRIKQLDAIEKLSPEQTIEKEELLKETGKLLNFLDLEERVDSAHKSFAKECGDYIKEQSKEADIFRARYEEYKKSQQEYIKAMYKGVSGDEMAKLEARHREIQTAFMHEFRRMTEKRITPLYESYKDYRPQELGDFITIMEKIIRRHEADLVAIMGTDVMAYRK